MNEDAKDHSPANRRRLGKWPLILGAVVLGLVAAEMYLRVQRNRELEEMSEQRREELVAGLEQRLASAAAMNLQGGNLVDARFIVDLARQNEDSGAGVDARIQEIREKITQIVEPLEGTVINADDRSPSREYLVSLPHVSLHLLHEILEPYGTVTVAEGSEATAEIGQDNAAATESDLGSHLGLPDVELEEPAFEPLPELPGTEQAAPASTVSPAAPAVLPVAQGREDLEVVFVEVILRTGGE